MNIIDTHAHLYDESFDSDIEHVVTRARDSGVEKIFLPAENDESLPKIVKLCSRFPGFFYPMAGLHPEEIHNDFISKLNIIQSQLFTPEMPFIAIGEVGLDLYWNQTFEQQQQRALLIQVEWALHLGLPLMLHVRAAHRQLISLLSPYKNSNLTGVFHCFSGTAEEARELLEFQGFMLGIGGVLTFKKSNLPEILRNVPLSRIVLETDAPYLAPVPLRGRRNESAYIIHTARKLAQIYNLSIEKVAEETHRNTMQIFPKAFNFA